MCTSVALVSCLSSSNPRYCWVRVALKKIFKLTRSNEDTHTSEVLVSRLSSLKPRYCWGCVVVDRTPQHKSQAPAPLLH